MHSADERRIARLDAALGEKRPDRVAFKCPGRSRRVEQAVFAAHQLPDSRMELQKIQRRLGRGPCDGPAILRLVAERIGG